MPVGDSSTCFNSVTESTAPVQQKKKKSKKDKKDKKDVPPSPAAPNTHTPTIVHEVSLPGHGVPGGDIPSLTALPKQRKRQRKEPELDTVSLPLASEAEDDSNRKMKKSKKLKQE